MLAARLIRIVLSSDAIGFSRNATLIASILRRTEAAVAVRFYTRGFEVPSFSSRQLAVEFKRCDAAVTGRYPGHVSEAVFDRLRIIADEAEWDRVLVMDHDMLALCDLAPYFQESFEGNLLMGRLFGPRSTLGLQMRRRGGLPKSLEDCGSYRYFYMGPMMNLAAMRREGTWERLLEMHETIGQDEQISLTAACGGRVKGVDKKWNLVPDWDDLETTAAQAPRLGEGDVDGIRWHDGVPAGVIHWTGGKKPWQRGREVWMPDLWEAESVSWEILREGLWDKPAALEVGSKSGKSVSGLLARGWKVTVISEDSTDREDAASQLLAEIPPFPDFSVESSDVDPDLAGVSLVRFGQDAAPAEWLGGKSQRPSHVVLEGPRSGAEVGELRALGYLAEARLVAKQWPDGGPHPEVLHFTAGEDRPIAAGELLYLARRGSPGPAPAASGYGVPRPGVDREPAPHVLGCLRDQLRSSLPPGSSVLVLASIPVTELLAKEFEGYRIVSGHFDLPLISAARKESWGDRVEFVHTPLVTPLPCLDLREIGRGTFDAVLAGPPRDLATDWRQAAIALAPWLVPGGPAITVQDGVMEASPSSASGASLPADGEKRLDGLSIFTAHCDGRMPHLECLWRNPQEIVECGFLVGDCPGREDLKSASERLWECKLEEVPMVFPDANSIPWLEARSMSDPSSPSSPGLDYVCKAVGEKRAVIQTLRLFIEGGAASGLILRSNCQWDSSAADIVREALRELPSGWDLVYFHLDSVQRAIPFSPMLAKIRKAWGGSAILWSREAALRILPGLERSEREWVGFLQEKQSELECYCVVPMPVQTGLP